MLNVNFFYYGVFKLFLVDKISMEYNCNIINLGFQKSMLKNNFFCGLEKKFFCFNNLIKIDVFYFYYIKKRVLFFLENYIVFQKN